MTYHVPGRPTGDWDDESWRIKHAEKREKHVLEDIISKLKTYKKKGQGVSLFSLSRTLKHRPDLIMKVVEKNQGRLINGRLAGFKTDRGYYVAWVKVNGDPILCLHGDEIKVIPIQQNQHKVTCSTCGATYLIEGRLCECGGSLKDEGKNLYCNKCGAVYLDCGGVFKRVLPTMEETGDFIFSRLGLRSPRCYLIDILDRNLGKGRPRLPCEYIKNVRNVVSGFLGPNPVRVE